MKIRNEAKLFPSDVSFREFRKIVSQTGSNNNSDSTFSREQYFSVTSSAVFVLPLMQITVCAVKY